MDPFCLTPWVTRYAPFALSAPSVQRLPDEVWIDQVVVDSRCVTCAPEGPRNCLFVALKGQHADGHAYLRDAAERGARYAIVQKGFHPSSSFFSLSKTLTLFYVEEPLRALQQIAALYRQEKAIKLIAVTGSRGKTLLKDVLVHLLSPLGNVYGSPESFNSQLGVALSLLRMRQTHTLAVVEAGISQQGEMSHLTQMLRPNVALLLNLIPEFGAPLENLELLAREKMELLMGVPHDGDVFLPDLPCLEPYTHTLRARVNTWQDLQDLAMISIKPIKGSREYAVRLPDLSEPYIMSLPARFWIELLSQALYVAYRLGVPSQQLVENLRLYTPESMETQIWRTTQGVTVMNSPYCADPQSIALAVRHLKQAPPSSKRFFFLHGIRPPYDAQTTLTYLEHALEKKEVDTVLLCGVGEETPLREAYGREARGVVRVAHVQAGLKWLAARAQHGDYIVCKGSHQLSLATLSQAFQDRTPYNVCIIDLTHISQNIARLRSKLSPQTELMIMVKALSYGTEAVRMAHFLSTCAVRFLGVSFVDEGVALKQAGVTQAIFSLYVDPQEVEKAVHFDLHVAVDCSTMIHALEQEAALQGKQVHVHLHVDTGMRRLGCHASEALKLAQEIACCPHLLFAGIFSHFAAADLPEEDLFTEQQFDVLHSFYQTLKAQDITPTYMHMGSSASLMRLPHLVGSMVRVGLALYDLGCVGSTAISLHSRIIALHHCPKGESVSYGRHYRASQDQTIAVVPLGYFDGIPRQWSGKVSLQVRGMRAPIVGSVCMDYLMLNVTDVSDVQVGDPVLVFGEDGHGGVQSLQALAQEGGEIVHALLAQMGPRIPRIFLFNG